MEILWRMNVRRGLPDKISALHYWQVESIVQTMSNPMLHCCIIRWTHLWTLLLEYFLNYCIVLAQTKKVLLDCLPHTHLHSQTAQCWVYPPKGSDQLHSFQMWPATLMCSYFGHTVVWPSLNITIPIVLHYILLLDLSYTEHLFLHCTAYCCGIVNISCKG